MTRRDFIGAAGALPAAAQRTGGAGGRPNILIVLSDDQRFDTIAALGNREVRTPNLDRLVRRGVSFTSAHIMGGTMGAVCVPSRAMLLTGQSLFHAHDAVIARTGRPFTLLPEVFRAAGYKTFGTGKWHNHPSLFTRAFAGGQNIFMGGMSDHFAVPVQDYDASGGYSKDRIRKGAAHSAELFSATAVEFLRDHRSPEPFLLYTALTTPHDPRTAPPRYHDLYTPEKLALPGNFLPQHPFDNGELKVRDEMLAPFPRTAEVIRRHTADYYAMITHMDAQVGRVLDALEETGRADNTIVVFAGDNGLAVGRHGLMGKQNLYDHSVRVPLVISGPGLPRNRRRTDFCYLFDIFPTLCELTGIAKPDTVEGMSLVPALRVSRAAAGRDSVFYAYRDFQRGVRTRDWKLIRYDVNGVRTTQLFQISDDPLEMRNVADFRANAERLTQMEALLEDWMRKVDDPLLRTSVSPSGPAR